MSVIGVHLVYCKAPNPLIVRLLIRNKLPVGSLNLTEFLSIKDQINHVLCEDKMVVLAMMHERKKMSNKIGRLALFMFREII